MENIQIKTNLSKTEKMLAKLKSYNDVWNNNIITFEIEKEELIYLIENKILEFSRNENWIYEINSDFSKITTLEQILNFDSMIESWKKELKIKEEKENERKRTTKIKEEIEKQIPSFEKVEIELCFNDENDYKFYVIPKSKYSNFYRSNIINSLSEAIEYAKSSEKYINKEIEEEKIKNEKMENEKEERKIEKENWIKNFGSKRIKDAFSLGYSTNKLYKEERTILEFSNYGEYGKDFFFEENDYDMKDSPSEKALNILNDLKEKGFEGNIVFIDKTIYLDENHYRDESEYYAEAIQLELKWKQNIYFYILIK